MKAPACWPLAALVACLSSLLTFFSLVIGIEDRWVRLAPRGSAPSFRSHHAIAWSASADGLYVFGGRDSDGLYFNDLHKYDRQANLWVQLAPSGSPPSARSDHAVAWSHSADGLYVFGGRDSSGFHFNDLYKYERQANLWVQLAPGGSPPSARSNHAVAWSDSADGLYVFGGTYGSGLYFDDLYKYERQANLWVHLAPRGSPPSARSDHAVAWSDAANGLYVFGGRDGGGFHNDLYKYERQADRWVQLKPTGWAPSARWGHAVGWSNAADAFYVFGGEDDRFGFISMHEYMRQADRWVCLCLILGSPPAARWGHAVAWSDAADALYVFGGRDDVGFYFNDLHKYERQAFGLALAVIGMSVGLGLVSLLFNYAHSCFCCGRSLTRDRCLLRTRITLGFGILSCLAVGVVAYSEFIGGLQSAAAQVLHWLLFVAVLLLPWTGFWFFGFRHGWSKETADAFATHYLVAPILLIYFAWRLFSFSYEQGMTAAIVGLLCLPPLPWSLHFLWHRCWTRS